MEEVDSFVAELLLVIVCLRQVIIFSLRRSGHSHIIHAHEDIAFFPLTWTCIACALSIAKLVPMLGPSMSEAHLGLVFTPQILTWFWCLQSRGEIAKSDFTAHCIGLAATLILLLSGSFFSAVLATLISGIALFRCSSFPRSRQSVFWFSMLIVSINRTFPLISKTSSEFVILILEVMMMFTIKFKLPVCFLFDRRSESKSSVENASNSELSESSKRVTSKIYFERSYA